MIRPVTCICFLLASGSGLYLYQAKHRVQVLDKEIEKTVRGTEEIREQTRILHAEWTLQNDPQRLQALADQFLSLKTVAPGQFTSMADLDSRLPAVRQPEPPPPEPKLVATALPPTVEEPPRVAPVPPPPKPAVVASVPAQPPPSRPVEQRPVEQRPVEQRPAEPRVVERKPPPPPPPHPVIAEAQPVRPVHAAPRPVTVAEPPRPVVASAPMPMTGSALGMAHGVSVPPPRPMPVSASQWVNNGGGGG